MEVDFETQHFIFLAGLHRSGTSLIHRIIRDHPYVSGLSNTNVPEDEGQHVQNVYPTAKEFGGPGQFAFHPKARMDENHNLVSKESSQTILRSWSPYIDLPNHYIVEKSPPNIIRTRFLNALFPNSLFIFIIRHPVAVAYATEKWTNNSILDLLEHTLHAYQIAISDSAFLNNYYFLRYEDFVLDPDKELGKIFELLKLPSCNLVYDVDKNINEKYFALWREDRNKNRNHLKNFFYRKKLKKLEDKMQVFGYSLAEPEKLEPYSI